MIQIKKITAAETYSIRMKILRKNIPLPYKFKGDEDSDTIHLGAYKENILIAVSSYMKVNNPNFSGKQYQLRGMATLEEYQGHGSGKLMLYKVFDMLKELKISYIWCNARLVAVPFYKKRGLHTFGELFDLPHIGSHYVMFKKLR